MPQRMASGSIETNRATPKGIVTVAPAASGRISAQQQRRKDGRVMCRVARLSATNNSGTATSGRITMPASGRKIMAAPKPEKPRTRPARVAAAASQRKRSPAR